MTIYDMYKKLFYCNLGQFHNTSKFYDILWFYDSVWELSIYKRRTFWKNVHPTSFFLGFSRSFSFSQEFFQESNYIPGVSRNSGHPDISQRIRSIMCTIIVVQILLYAMQCALFSHQKLCFKNNFKCFIWVQK